MSDISAGKPKILYVKDGYLYIRQRVYHSVPYFGHGYFNIRYFRVKLESLDLITKAPYFESRKEE